MQLCKTRREGESVGGVISSEREHRVNRGWTRREDREQRADASRRAETKPRT